MSWFILALLFSHRIRYMSSIYGHIVLHCKDNDVRIASCAGFKEYPNGSSTFYGAWALEFKPHLAPSAIYLSTTKKIIASRVCVSLFCMLNFTWFFFSLIAPDCTSLQASSSPGWVLGFSSDACSWLWDCNGFAAVHSSCIPGLVSFCFRIPNSYAL